MNKPKKVHFEKVLTIVSSCGTKVSARSLFLASNYYTIRNMLVNSEANQLLKKQQMLFPLTFLDDNFVRHFANLRPDGCNAYHCDLLYNDVATDNVGFRDLQILSVHLPSEHKPGKLFLSNYIAHSSTGLQSTFFDDTLYNSYFHDGALQSFN